MNSQKGYIGLTDPEWYSFLHNYPKVDEVNFWQPHGNRAFRALSQGDLFFFKLRAPQKAIAGFGFFQRYESLPAWLAWDCFGEMNGAPNIETMINRICILRGDNEPSFQSGNFEIGCIMISAPVFFKENEWVTPPDNWAKTGIQQGKRYELNHGEGQRVLNECLERANSGIHYWNIEQPKALAAEPAERYGSAVSVRPRLGQGLFSLAVRDAYEGACAVTHEHSTPVLEAAHILPYARGGQHKVDNGLLLRRDLHSLYDRGYVTVTGDFIFRVGDKLREEFKNGRSYYDLSGFKIAIPKNELLHPNRDLLDWHAHEVFRK